MQHEVYEQGERNCSQNAHAPFLDMSSCLHGVKYKSAVSRNPSSPPSPGVMMKLRITMKSLAVSRACANFSRAGKRPLDLDQQTQTLQRSGSAVVQLVSDAGKLSLGLLRRTAHELGSL